MKKNTPYFYFVLFLLAGLTACKKPPVEPEPTEPVMPPLTHQGLNTFGCYVDGELFVAGGAETHWDLPPILGSFNEGTKKLIIRASSYSNVEDDVSEHIDFRAYLTDNTANYNYTFNEEDGSDGYTNLWGDRCDYYFRTISDFDHGQLAITYLDEEENIIAGTFYMNLVNENCENDTLMKITDGRFDFHY
ncbi:MAG: hypothetical protein GQ574_06420 [Crocinitomix sp.]|nr:hypothetical protein [Crocinitomix sp.]